MERTPYYDLTMDDESEYYSVGRVNENTRKIDTALHGLDTAFVELSKVAGAIVEMPPAVELGARRDGAYYLDRRASYNRGV